MTKTVSRVAEEIELFSADEMTEVTVDNDGHGRSGRK